MKETTEELLDKADRAIEAARVLLDSTGPEFAAGRAYYAMFYVAEALLHERGQRFSKHSAVHAAFGKTFAKPALLDPKYHRWLLDAFDLRLQDDYEVLGVVNEELVEEMLEQARGFLDAARRFLADSTESSAPEDVSPPE
jgi:uncharacterized protein (UPF0332 family)